MSQHFVIEVETTGRDLRDADRWVSHLEPWHGVVSVSPTGNLVVTLSLPAEDLAQACATGLALITRLTQPVTVQAQPESLRDTREGWQPVPELLSVTESAALLGVSRQRVLQLIEAGKLPAARIGNVYGLPASAVRQSIELNEGTE